MTEGQDKKGNDMKKLKRKLLRKAAKIAVDSLKDNAVKSATKSLSGSGQSWEKPASKTIGSITVREMRRSDRPEVMVMMREAFFSEAPLTADTDAAFSRTISECLSDSKFLDGFVFAYKDADDSLWGYALVAHGFSTQTGKPCMWIDDLYLREEARGLGLTSSFLSYMGEVYGGEELRQQGTCHQHKKACGS